MTKRHNVSDKISNWFGSYETEGTIGLQLEDMRLSDVGRKVMFHAHHDARELGVISSWNDYYIFCRFDQGDTAAACDPDQLEFVIRGPLSVEEMRT